MATILQIKRRVTGAAGAPTSLKTAELSWNMVDGYLYGGFGDDGAGNATSIKTLGKDDFLLAQRVPSGGTSGQILTVDGSGNIVWAAAPQNGVTYTAGTGITIVGASIAADTAVLATQTNLASGLATKANTASPTFTGTPLAPTASGGTNTTQIATTAFVAAATASKANLASPTFTGTPAAPTPAAGTNNTTLATTSFVSSAISTLIGGADAAYDTLKELQTAYENDASGIAALNTAVGNRLVKANNLSDLTDFSAARTNLGLGSMALQAASAVAITGGTINGVALDGGTF